MDLILFMRKLKDKMFAKKDIDNFLILNKRGDNYSAQNDFHKSSLILKLIEAKILVDRWGLISSDLIIHSSHKDYVHDSLNKRDFYEKSENETYIWGVKIHYIDECPPNKGILLSYPNNSVDGRNIAVFPM